MTRTHTIYIAVMSLAGAGFAFLAQAWPGFRDGAAPPMMFVLLVSLAIDVAAMNRLFGMTPLTMGLRFGGVLSAAILYMLVDFALTRTAATA